MRLALLITSTAIALSTPATAQETWTVDASRAACLLDNIDLYLERSDGNPIVVVLPACPETDTNAALGALQQNSGAQPGVTVRQDDDSLDEIVFYSRSELNCLKGLSLDLSRATVDLPQNPCD